MTRSIFMLVTLLMWISTFVGCGGVAPDQSSDTKSIAPSARQPYREFAGDERTEEGRGPGAGGDRFDHITDNPFYSALDAPLSTFSIDVDTASYAKTRMFLMQQNTLPPPDAVRIEELVNYFTYNYKPPTNGEPFAARVEVSECPWQTDHRLVRIGIKGRVVNQSQRPSSNLVFLLDVSGSMNRPNKLPLLKRGMKLLVDQLNENDSVAIVVYAGAAGQVLPPTTGDKKRTILNALDRLRSGGSTNGGEGIRLAYGIALDHYIPGGTNRVILCSDGDFNVGTTSNGELVRLVESNAKNGVFLSVLGFGIGNHNDSMLEQISNKGNGNYAFVDSDSEARKVLVNQMSGTLVTIAKDVKIQVEFNPATVSEYRLIGYENRMLAAQDFNDDQKDAGEIGAGHRVTALYEVTLVGVERNSAAGSVDPLKYQKNPRLSKAARTGELCTVKIRYKAPEADDSKLLTFTVNDENKRFSATSPDHKLAAAVASFGMLLRNSKYKGQANYDAVLKMGGQATSFDPHGYRREFLQMARRAQQLAVNRE